MNKKTEVEDCLKLSIYTLNQQGFLDNDSSGVLLVINDDIHEISFSFANAADNPSINLQYCSKNNYGQKEFVDYDIKLAYLPCSLGGIRPFFLCSSIKANNGPCNKLCAVLYKPNYSHYFACRSCHDLTYEACNLSGKWKEFGKQISAGELEEARKRAKRPLYRNNTTRKFNAYIKKLQKFKANFTKFEKYINNSYVLKNCRYRQEQERV
jgi:hypothetical protein